jgi:hypothetical protein
MKGVTVFRAHSIVGVKQVSSTRTWLRLGIKTTIAGIGAATSVVIAFAGASSGLVTVTGEGTFTGATTVTVTAVALLGTTKTALWTVTFSITIIGRGTFTVV